MEDFLGIRIENLGPHKFKLTQSGFTNKVLVTSKIEFFIRIDRDGELFEENWEYSIIVGILNYGQDCRNLPIETLITSSSLVSSSRMT